MFRAGGEESSELVNPVSLGQCHQSHPYIRAKGRQCKLYPYSYNHGEPSIPDLLPPNFLYLTYFQADKLRTQQQLEQLQSRYVGTGHADTTKFEWTSNIHRDSYASYIGHPPLLEYMAIGMGEPKERVRAMMIEVRSS